MKPVYVTQPVLPPLEEFLPYLEDIWKRRVLTNGGPVHKDLEQALCDYLGVQHLSLFSNGTLALVTALQALRVSGEVITTPYSFVATSHAIMWNGLKPVFADVDPGTFNLSPKHIEAAITSQTTAILPVHCYGRPCDVEGIQELADQYNLRVIYDAAHAFGVKDAGGSVLRHGDLSVLSFHATKVFSTLEGGAIICPDAKTKQRIDYLKNFGFANETTVVATGINGKMNEIQAAFGMLSLKHIDAALARRQSIATMYFEGLALVPGITCALPPDLQSNYGYFPILVDDTYPLERDALYQLMRDRQIFGRRYFYPLISDFPMYRTMPSAAAENLPVARSISQRVICLPIYPALEDEDVQRTIALIHDASAAHQKVAA
ncbi:DegT/DnrJ/EryC1/StrS family aminotransferase [Alcaligenaceae bacterium A4P071]|nr:DegT/DnrJ/EryC1/StrS family aminotransferase [Alcaligenaceae bacterium A4P071]